MAHIVLHASVSGFGHMHQFRCYLQGIITGIREHAAALSDSNYLLKRLRLFSQKVASFSLKAGTKLSTRFQFRALEVTGSLSCIHWQIHFKAETQIRDSPRGGGFRCFV